MSVPRIVSIIGDEIKTTLLNPVFWVAGSIALPIFFIIDYVKEDYTPRKDALECHTVSESLERKVYRTGKFDDEQTVKLHLDELMKEDFDAFRYGVWKYTQFWYRPICQAAGPDSGLGMEPYSEIVKGIPGSCTEGAVAFYANMRKIVELPDRKEKLEHYILIFTYEKTDRSGTAGHALYIGEITNEEDKKRYFIGGINPFENPLIEYDSVAEAIERNTDLFRKYGHEHLTKKGVMIRPQRFCLIQPEKDLGIDIVKFSRENINVKTPDRDPREPIAVYIQRKFMEYFDKHAEAYVEPWVTKKK